jgi:streptogramin lyase
VRPCATGYANGFTGGPTHLDLGPDGALWAAEGQDDKIARFDLKTKTAREIKLPKGAEPHDLAVGPDGNMWFSSFNGGIGKIDVDTLKVQVFKLPSKGAQPHIWWAGDGLAYFGNLATGLLTTFDHTTGRFKASGIHSFAELPDGSAWWTLQKADKIAHFNLQTHRFDKFVDMPRGSGPHWAVYRDSEHALWVVGLYSNRLVRYDLDSGATKQYSLGLDPVTPQQVADRAPLPDVAQILEDAQHEAIWATTLAGGEVRRFDLKTHEVTRVGCGMRFPSQTTTMANDRQGALWVTERPAAKSGAGRLDRIDR